jgi:mannose-1-phosphate guanylyltransferase/phosphomannomutase
MLSWLQKPLHEVVAELPSIYMAQHEVPCPWQRKGAVMRALTVEAQESDQSVELIDGVRLIKSANEWVLALPDAAEPIFRVRAEGATLSDAHERAEEWATKIRTLSAE